MLIMLTSYVWVYVHDKVRIVVQAQFPYFRIIVLKIIISNFFKIKLMARHPCAIVSAIVHTPSFVSVKYPMIHEFRERYCRCSRLVNRCCSMVI